MNIRRILTAGALAIATTFTAATANAADIPMAPVAPPPPPPPAPVFDWAGGYGGIYGGASVGVGLFGHVGAQVGYNFVSGGFLAGIEGQAGALIAGGGVGFDGRVNARLGAILGDKVLLYAEAGAGIWWPVALPYTFGGGIEIAVGQSASIFAEAKGYGLFGGGCCGIIGEGGINWHF